MSQRDLQEIDACEALVLVDNVSDPLSTVPPGVTSEISPTCFAPELGSFGAKTASYMRATRRRLASGRSSSGARPAAAER